jgi:hypothetical protein
MGKGDFKLEIRGNVDFLTDFPQVSYFDIVYKRYTNFATEMIYLPVSGSLEFGEQITCILPKSGDLIHKMYLAATLSEVAIPRVTNISGLDRTDQSNVYSNFKTFLNIIYPVYRAIIEEQANVNFNIVDIVSIFTTILSNPTYSSYPGTTPYNNFYGTNFDFIEQFNTVTMYGTPSYNYNLAFDSTTGYLNLGMFLSFNDLTKYYDELLFSNTQGFGTITNYNFAWQSKIGNLLIKQIDLEIGGQKIDRQFSDWLNIWSELTINSYLQPTYNKMIGNIDILTKYDANSKPQYQLLIPLQFFFNRYLECSLPIIFFRYHEVKLIITLNDLLSIVQVDPQLTTDNINIDNYISLVDARLLTEYIYLDEDERIKFATYSHEYLIDYVQVYNEDIISQTQTINYDFFNSVKALYFFIRSYQSLSFHDYKYDSNVIVTGTITNQIVNNKIVPIFILDTQYYDQFTIDSTLVEQEITLTNSNFYNHTYTVVAINNNQFQFNGTYEGDDTATLIYNYTVPNGNQYRQGPLNNFQLLFESYPRQKTLDGIYLNQVIPYKCHTCIPNDGIYMYNFSISPEDYQPSGSCNHSALRYKAMILALNDNFWNYASLSNTPNNSKAKVTIYGLTYNILRLSNGMGALYFSA